MVGWVCACGWGGVGGGRWERGGDGGGEEREGEGGRGEGGQQERGRGGRRGGVAGTLPPQAVLSTTRKFKFEFVIEFSNCHVF